MPDDVAGAPRTRRLSTVDRLRLMGETVIDSKTVSLQILAELVLFTGFVMFLLGAALHTQMKTNTVWTVIAIPLWISDVLGIAIFIVALVAPIPYLKQLARFGMPRIGNNPSGTELISITITVICKIIATSLILVFQINIARYLDSPSQHSLAAAGVPLYVLQILALCYTILIDDHTLQIAALDVASILFYFLLVLKIETQTVLSFWLVLSPLHILNCIVLILLINRRVCSSSTWNTSRTLLWTCLVLGSILLEISLCLLSGILTGTWTESLWWVWGFGGASVCCVWCSVCASAVRCKDPLWLPVEYTEVSDCDMEDLLCREPLLASSEL